MGKLHSKGVYSNSLFLDLLLQSKQTLGSGQFGSVVSVKVKNTKLDRAIKIIPKSRVRD